MHAKIAVIGNRIVNADLLSSCEQARKLFAVFQAVTLKAESFVPRLSALVGYFEYFFGILCYY